MHPESDGTDRTTQADTGRAARAAAGPGHHPAALNLVRWLLALFPFISYPLALVIPVGLGVRYLFHVPLPTFVWLSLMSLSYLLLVPLGPLRSGTVAGSEPGKNRRALAGGLQLVFLLFALLCAASAAHGKTVASELVFAQIGYLGIPLFFAVCPRGLLPRQFPLMMTVLWGVQLAHGFWQWNTGADMMALAGNPNWMSTLVVALLPWPWVVAATRRRGPERASRRRFAPDRLRRTAWIAGTAALGLVLAFKARCLGTWVVLAGYVMLHGVMPRLSKTLRCAVAVAAAVAVVEVLMFTPERVTRMLSEDIRIPLYTQTAHMVCDYRFFGVGPGNFRREFVKYRSLAHKQRRVAATVTEHPHNELLHVAACLGIPAAVIWPVLLCPLFRRPRATPFWRAVHFTAFMIVGHGMLDKTLVQPPSSLLGFMFLGLLWRPRLHVRSRPDLRPPALHLLCVPVALMVAVYGFTVATRHVRTGWGFRKARLCEERGRHLRDHGHQAAAQTAYRKAYEHFRRCAQVDPGNVRAHAFAGIAANNKLRNPSLALPHLRRAFLLDPNFAHVNGEIGLAYGGLRKHDTARSFFQREAQLFPFDVLAHERLFMSKLVTGDMEAMEPLFERIGRLRARQVRNRLGADEAERTAARLLLALQKNDAAVAIRCAGRLLAPFEGLTVEPVAMGLMQKAGGDRAYYRAPPGLVDYRYWRRQLLWHRLGRANRLGTDPARLLEIFRANAAAIAPEESIGRGQALTEFLTQCGATVAFTMPNGETPAATARICWKGNVVAIPVADLIPEQNPGPGGAQQATRNMSVSPLQFAFRTQALGHVLAHMIGPVVPDLAYSPSLKRLEHQRAAAAADAARAQETGVLPLPRPLLTFAHEPFTRFGAATPP